jgi:hypothetical protein
MGHQNNIYHPVKQKHYQRKLFKSNKEETSANEYENDKEPYLNEEDEFEEVEGLLN